MCQQIFDRFSIDFRQIFKPYKPRIHLIYPSDTLQIPPQIHPRYIPDTSQIHPRYTPDTPQIHLRYLDVRQIFDRFSIDFQPRYTPDTPHIHLVYTSDTQMFDRFSIDFRQMFDRFSIDVRQIFDRCSIDFRQTTPIILQLSNMYRKSMDASIDTYIKHHSKQRNLAQQGHGQQGGSTDPASVFFLTSYKKVWT